MYDLTVIGGGPSGFFSAVQAKDNNKNLKVIILEKSAGLFSKVKVSGGGRCNITNAIPDVREFSLNYPRGRKELISPLSRFSPVDMIHWLEERGVAIKVDKNNKVFPCSDDSQTIIDCFFNEINKHHIEIKYGQNIVKIKKHKDFFEITLDSGDIYTSKKIVLATGSSDSGALLAEQLGHKIIPFIPSLFSLKIAPCDILKLSGISQKAVKVSLSGKKYSYTGDILITHEGFSGPAVINLSAFAAIFLNKQNYKTSLSINWTTDYSANQIYDLFIRAKKEQSNKHLSTINLFSFSSKLWSYFLDRFDGRLHFSIKNIANTDLKKLSEMLSSDTYTIISKSKNKSEFVSCGGIDLKEVNFKDMQSKICSNLYFVGELLNIDGITGGYNLQNAWTTGYVAGDSMSFY